MTRDRRLACHSRRIGTLRSGPAPVAQLDRALTPRRSRRFRLQQNVRATVEACGHIGYDTRIAGSACRARRAGTVRSGPAPVAQLDRALPSEASALRMMNLTRMQTGPRLASNKPLSDVLGMSEAARCRHFGQLRICPLLIHRLFFVDKSASSKLSEPRAMILHSRAFTGSPECASDGVIGSSRHISHRHSRDRNTAGKCSPLHRPHTHCTPQHTHPILTLTIPC